MVILAKRESAFSVYGKLKVFLGYGNNMTFMAKINHWKKQIYFGIFFDNEPLGFGALKLKDKIFFETFHNV